MNKEQGLELIKERIKDFEKNFDLIKKGAFGETNIRTNYIDKLFEALGWEITNIYEVEREFSQKDKSKESSTKRVDYAFKINNKIKFFVEAKDSSVDLEHNKDAIFQAKRYAYSSNGKAPIVILTDFEEFRVFNVLTAPHYDNPDEHLLKNYCFKYDEYIQNWDLLWETFSKEAIENNSLQNIIGTVTKNTRTMDREFLDQITKWREILAKNIAIRNESLSVDEINEAVQRILDRLIFIRNLEDREIEPADTLFSIASTKTNILNKLTDLFHRLNNVYNGLLFKPHFSENIIIDDKVLCDIIKEMCYPISPFQFDIIEPEILGRIYEKFLGSKIRLTESHRAKVEEKIEVRKAGGVYYTPEYIVEYIVKNTVGEKIEGLTPKEIENIKILDPACGSGSFLLGAYSYLLNYHQRWYEEHKDEKEYKDEWYKSNNGEIKIRLEKRANILKNNIYGVDIDKEATEVATMSLYLKMLDDGFDKGQRDLFFVKGAVLPDMSRNIKCGNSLIGTDYFNDKINFDTEEFKKIRPFDWEKEFPDFFSEKMSNFYLITFETQYSREQGNTDSPPIYLTDDERLLVAECIVNEIKKLGVKLLAASILPDHVHLVIADMGVNTEKIVKQIKSVSALEVNRRFKSSVPGEGYQQSLWSKSFNLSFLDDDDHLFNAIEYVNNNYIKHSDKWTDTISQKINEIFKPILYNMDDGFRWADFQYYNNGFDVVIGNPPWVDIKGLDKELVRYYFKKYKTAENRINLYALFIERSLNLLKQNGYFSFIVPNSILYQTSYTKLRKFVLENFSVNSIVRLPDNIFENVKAETCILTIKNEINKNNYVNIIIYENNCLISEINNYNSKMNFTEQQNHWEDNEYYFFNIFINNDYKNILNKIENNKQNLEFYCDFSLGITPYDKYAGHTENQIKNRIFHSNYKKNDTYKELLSGEDIKRYFVEWGGKEYISYGNWLAAPRKKEFFTGEKIFIRQIISGKPPRIYGAYTDKEYYITQIGFSIISKTDLSLKYILALINSKLMTFYHKNKYLDKTKNLFQKILIKNAKTLPIPTLDLSNSKDKEIYDSLITLVDQMLQAQKDYHNSKSDLDKELNSKKIDMIDKSIDALVYKLYDLSSEEIDIIEKDFS